MFKKYKLYCDVVEFLLKLFLMLKVFVNEIVDIFFRILNF